MTLQGTLSGGVIGAAVAIVAFVLDASPWWWLAIPIGLWLGASLRFHFSIRAQVSDTRRKRVFVYGTLKEGFPNFGANTGTRVPGAFITKLRYPLYLVGERHSPWMINSPGEGEQVLGQVFEVKPEVLERLDVLQRVDAPDGYERIQIGVGSQSAKPEEEWVVHAYLKHPRNLAGAKIIAGPFAEYTLEQAALYRARKT